ncbi:MAG: hypothetical protein J6Y37_01530, partial [Paludibacteraceae bacterium]|nr:hypothetical protein [Paludibacteraceae bacterium]
ELFFLVSFRMSVLFLLFLRLTVACYAFPVSFLFVYRQFLKDLSFRTSLVASATSVSICFAKLNKVS